MANVHTGQLIGERMAPVVTKAKLARLLGVMPNEGNWRLNPHKKTLARVPCAKVNGLFVYS